MSREVDACFRHYGGHVYRWAYAMCRRREDALDTVQEVFTRLLRSRPVLPHPAALRAWLRRTCARVVIDRWRSEASRTAVHRARAASAQEARELPESAAQAEEQSEAIRAATGRLSEQQRYVLLCKCCDGMTFQQIAEELRVAVPTVKTHYLRALARLRDELGVTTVAGTAGTSGGSGTCW